MVHEKQRPAAADDEKVLKPLVLEIREKSASRAIQHSHSGFFGHILERPIAAVAIEPVGKPRGLAHIEIIQSISIKISCGQTVVPIDVDSARSVQSSAPIIHSVEHLISV